MFKIVDVRSRQVLAERVGARAAIEALREVRSIVDVSVDVWQPGPEKWRRLTLDELRALWDFRGRDLTASAPAAGAATP